ncbi:MAG: AAA family ATPase [Bacteroidetes bacterium]|nr:AAA family ATPase [Bacteroidota bacterium]
MDTPDALSPEALYRRCDPSIFDFETTADLEAQTHIVGQDRAVEAVQFGIGISQDGYNIFVLGPPGTGRHALVRHYLDEAAQERSAPSDWCYVKCFEDARTPRMLQLPPGVGTELRKDMEQFVEDLKSALPAAFESEEYQMSRQAIQEEATEEEEHKVQQLQERAQEEGVALLRTPNGFAFAPVEEGEVISQEAFQQLGEEEKERLQEAIEQFQDELRQVMRQVPQRQREARKRIRELNREVAEYAVGDLLKELRETYADYDDVVTYLEAVRNDIVENVETIVGGQQRNPFADESETDGGPSEEVFFRRYRVNVVVDNSEAEGAPVVYEDNPHYQNLVGRVEQIARMGALVTDFNLIKGGALHRANGGYLVLEARKLLMAPFAWEGLKRALFANEIRIESPQQALGLISTVTLEPEAIPLDVKVVLLGTPLEYYLLKAYDPDFSELFKVMADFDERTDREDATQRRFADLIAHLTHEDDLRALDREAMARVVERAARLAGDAEKLSTHLQSVHDLVREADYWAGTNGHDVITAADVQRAIDAQVRRADRIRERIHEEIQRDTILIDTEGAVVGQVNGLAVLQAGDFAFGKPNRITARVRLGKGEVVDIEREVALGGPIHSKGVLILAGLLGGRYAQQQPLSLSASLVFEQSYGGVEGDSASSAELYALLSALAEVPLKQSLAVTGSVNQRGQVQPIGGVNEKIEGFFDVCKGRGLTGEQGVLIPHSNVKHLMLRQDVVEAVEAGRFHVYPVEIIDQGLALLTGQPAGAPDEQGQYPEGTVNHRVTQRLAQFAARRRQFVMTDGASEAMSDA